MTVESCFHQERVRSRWARADGRGSVYKNNGGDHAGNDQKCDCTSTRGARCESKDSKLLDQLSQVDIPECVDGPGPIIAEDWVNEVVKRVGLLRVKDLGC